MSTSLVPLKTRRIKEQYTLNLSTIETSSSGRGVVLRRMGARVQVSSRCPLTMVQNYENLIALKQENRDGVGQPSGCRPPRNRLNK
ncbi:hypothetical protein TNCV_3179931 [Trichonephila clavipes]|nr:hypothetical protein TNCV_3179931 [Trichonephila clavipes]